MEASALDTNTLIYFFKGMGRVAESMLDQPPSEVAIPSVVLYELEFGSLYRPLQSVANANSRLYAKRPQNVQLTR